MSEFHSACNTTEIPEGGMKLVEVDDRLVIVFRRGDDYYCIDDICTHDGGTLSDGECTSEFKIACPRHGAEFDIRSGEAITMPATEDTLKHEVKLDGDQILVKLNEE